MLKYNCKNERWIFNIIHTVVPRNITTGKCDYEYKLELPNICPICNTTITPTVLNSSYIETFTLDPDLFITLFCPSCEQSFIAYYATLDLQSELDDTVKLIDVAPHSKHITSFSDNLSSLSPSFVEIYNQTEQAESNSLHLITGLGYRKSLEFLIKDFAIHISPENEKTIKNMPLNQCIKKYISETKLKTLAEKATWLGNDETHYIRKHLSHDVSDMKTFIQAVVYFIDMTLVTEDAAKINPK